MSAEDELLKEAPALISQGTQELLSRAKALGLQWTLRKGTVTVNSNVSALAIIFDGDKVEIVVTNLSGRAYGAGEQVMCLIVPPSGNYVLGPINSGVPGAGALNVQAASGTTTSGTYVDMPGPAVATFVKASAASTLLLNFSCTWYSVLGAGTVAEFALELVSANLTQDYTIAHLFLSAPILNAHIPTSGTNILENLEAGLYAVTARWRRTAGTGILTQDGNDWISFTVVEQ